MLAKHLPKRVTARKATGVIEQFLQDGMQLRHTLSRVGLAILTGILHNNGLYGISSRQSRPFPHACFVCGNQTARKE